ncbi:hypothetical protein J2X36_005293 [Methylobacterium sp. BE186]|uniref:hypothetical protein n=1 Tax=Methylobacterium sp. BE186 TaxID=2817715 RepID=UPI0028663410|nr:hypothetical protein [Methylobacterium sp. BE186]MDR7040510.1 hypothetical protein [Methylobacterium sp. BE186]
MRNPNPTLVEDVRSRVAAGMNVRLGPLAKFAGLSPTALRLAVERGDIKVIRLGRNILIPHHEAARLLGMEAA